MAALIPSSNVEAAYEDMFKEITRKLYGEETGNGLHTLGTPVAQVATTGPTAPEGERSFTNLQIDRTSAPTIEYDHNAGAGGVSTSVATAAVAAAAAAQNANVVIQQQPEGSVVVATTGGGNFKSEDHLSTAFGLAALMQNGFATTGTILSTQAINKVVTNAAGQQQQQPQTVAGDQQQRWSNDGTTATAAGNEQQQQQPQIVQWTTGGKLQSYTTAQQHQQQQHQQQQVITTPKSKSKNRIEHTATATEIIYTSPSTSGNTVNVVTNQPATNNTTIVANPAVSSSGGGAPSRKKSNNSNNSNQQNGNNGNNNGGVQIQKRYACTHCPYSTDRRDLYTRHENIHKDEKPFQCYACLKQFNRADHVKKHFLRMHREMQYDINKTRRHVPSSSSNHHNGGRGNITITNLNTASNSTAGSPEQKPNIFHTANVQIDNAFLEGQRQPTSSSLSIAETIEAVATATDVPLPQLKQEKIDDGSVIGGNIKPKREKRFTCCYCPWSGADKWGLKRHLNTHTKPFVCLLCDYKAARSERLATHVLKVHSKRACNKCSFLADTQEEFQSHISEVHPHDIRPARNNSNSSNNTNSNVASNINVLRTIGNTLVTNNQLNTFQNSGTAFGVGNTTTTNANAGGSVTIYTTTTTNDGSGGNIAGGPLQEIIVNPSSMVGWRLSANGSLIPPHDLLTGGLPNAAAQKRGSERLFQYLEADGSDPEDYARLLKMDAISRNTASVAQDFHKAGGVHELKIPANHQLLFNNKLPTQWSTKEAAALLHSLSNANNLSFAYNSQRSKYNGGAHHNQPHQNGVRQRQYSTGEDDENTPSSASSTSSHDNMPPVRQDRKQNVAPASDQRQAMSAFLGKNFGLQEAPSTVTPAVSSEMASSKLKRKYQQPENDEDQENQAQLIRSPPAYKHTNHHHKVTTKTQLRTNPNMSREHRLELIRDNKENTNAATFLTTMEYQNLNKIGTQFHNYVKDIINKYYAEPSLMLPALPTATTTPQQSQHTLPHASPKRKRMMSETEEYIEYLRNKEDITLTITPKVTATTTTPPAKPQVSFTPRPSVIHKPQAPSKRHEELYAPTNLRKPNTPKKPSPQEQSCAPKPRKSLSQIATLLPLLADAASQQQYLAAPLDFSKKSTQKPEPAEGQFDSNCNSNSSNDSSTSYTENSMNNSAFGSASKYDKRNSRKQAQPKKIRTPPELVVAMLRDKYLNRMVGRKLSCRNCSNNQKTAMLVFNYHTKGSLALHCLWKHKERKAACTHCRKTFRRYSSLQVHCRRVHACAPKTGEGKAQSVLPKMARSTEKA